MEAGKHVYCEKPLTLTAEQSIEVRDAVKRYGKKLQVGPQRTSQDKYWNAQKVIRDGRIGDVTWAQGSWNRNTRGSGASTMVAIKMGVESYRRSKTLIWDAEKEQIQEG